MAASGLVNGLAASLFRQGRTFCRIALWKGKAGLTTMRFRRRLPSRSAESRMIRFLVANGGIGFAFGLALAALLVWQDVHGIAGLMESSIGLGRGMLILASLFGPAFAGIAIATGVMLLGRPEGPTAGPRPVPVRLRRTGRRGGPE